MKSEEREARSGELSQIFHPLDPQSLVLDPQSQVLDPACMERTRWRCRRGLLELDFVLGRFIEQHYAGLDEAQQAAFDELLDMPDTALWNMVAGRQEATQSEQQALLEKIRAV